MNHLSQPLRTGLALALLLGTSGAAEKSPKPEHPVKVITLPGGLVAVKAKTGPGNTVHVLADSQDGPCYLKSTDGGKTFSVVLTIVDASTKKPGLKYFAQDLAIGKDGRVHVAMCTNGWELKLPQEEWALFYARLAPGAKAFTPVKNLNRKSSEGFSIAADDRGNVTASFLSGKLYTMASHDNGDTFGPYAEPNPAWDPCDCCTTATTYGVDGALALLYREETKNERDIYLALTSPREGSTPQRVKVSGTPWKIDGCPVTCFAITPTPSGYVAAWPTKGQIYYARLDKTGAVLPPGEIRTPGQNGFRTGIFVLNASDDATLVGWKYQDKLGWQLFNAKGEPQGGSATSPGGGATGVVLPDKTFLIFL